MPGRLPSGTVTLMFTDIESSTALLHRLGDERFAVALQEHRDVVRAATERYDGVEIDTEGDGFFVAFPTASGAVDAALAAQEGLTDAGTVKIRIGLHTGVPLVVGDDYVGADVHLAARIASAGHGGQVLLSAPTRALVTADTTDLGEHRLKDFEDPVHLFQLGSVPFPPLKTLSTGSIPRPASSFVGRSAQVDELLEMIRDHGARFVTLTGPGGSGKTRVAIEVATELVGTVKAGVFWVGLAAIRDCALVLATIAQVIGAKDAVADHIADREMLIVIDNLEHVLEAATDLANLVERCANLTVLATSRERLRVRGEQEFPVPPLKTIEAVELFASRAHSPASDEVTELCERLDNLPLAIELAAARTRVLTVRQILDRLSLRLDLFKGGRDADDRQQTLRTTMDWSYGLLSDDEQRLFRRFSVFMGGATLEATESVVDADVDLLESLVDKSLLTFDNGRFGMLETIRQYAAERLTSSSDGEIARRHAHFFSAIGEAEQLEVLGVDPRAALDRLEIDYGNLRATLDWFESTGDVQRALQLSGALWEFWCLRTHFGEGFDRLERLLSLDATPTAARANALTGSTHLALGAGADLALSRARAEEALTLQREFGDPWGVAFAEYQYAQVFADEGDFAVALAHLKSVVERWREVGDEHRELQAMRSVASAYRELGDAQQHRQLHEEILRRGRLIGDREVQWWSLGELAAAVSQTGRYSDAVENLRHAYTLEQELDAGAAGDVTMVRLASVLSHAGGAAVAGLALGHAERVAQLNDFVYPPWLATTRDEALALCREALGAETLSAILERGHLLSADDVFDAATAALREAFPSDMKHRHS